MASVKSASPKTCSPGIGSGLPGDPGIPPGASANETRATFTNFHPSRTRNELTGMKRAIKALPLAAPESKSNSIGSRKTFAASEGFSVEGAAAR
jgi:hypothetical protein